MGLFAEWLRRFVYLINRRSIERDLEKEMQTHREMMGDSRPFGNTLRLREEARDVWGWNWLDAIRRDMVYAARSLRKSPGFAVASVLILTLGIGVNLAFFSIVNSTLLRPLAVRDPNSLVRFDRIWRAPNVDSISSAVPYPATQFLRRNNTVLSAILTQTDNEIVWGDDPAGRLRGSFVSANFFQELGAASVFGRLFTEEEDEKADAAPVIALGEEFWDTRFGRDPGVIGKTVRINNRPAVVIGIVPRPFPGLKLMQQDVKVWLPINQIDYFAPGTKFKTGWAPGGPELYGRLRAGISPAAAKDALRTPMAELAAQHPAEFNVGEWLEPYSGRLYFERPEDYRQRIQATLLAGILFLLVLLVACANLSSIVLSRSMNKVRELSVRTALGASAWRILSHLVTESAWIAVAGTFLGTFLGYWILRVFAVHIEATSWLHWTPDWRTAAASLAFSAFAMVALGLVPAWKVARRKQQLTDAIKDGGQQASAALGKTRLRQVLISVQIACSCVLLVVAASLLRQLQSVLGDPGFDFANVAVLNPHLDRFGTPSGEARSYWSSVKAALSAAGQIESVSLTHAPPLGNSVETSRFPDAPGMTVTIERTDSNFFKTMNIPILAGRTFSDADDFRTTVIISRRLAMKIYGSLDVIGRSFPKSKPERTIVGVAADARLFRFNRDDAEAYFILNPERLAGVSLIARTRTNPATLIPSMMQIARTYNDRIQPDIHPMSKDFAQKTDGSKTMSLIGTSLATLAVALACLGIFGLLSYAISLRTKEIGIRVALGAKQRSILMLVVSQLFWPMPVGVVAGLSGGLAAVYAMQAQPTFIRPTDTILVGVVVFVFIAAAGLASLLPVLRATRVDVLHALRYE